MPDLEALLDAFNAHDLNAIMSFFTEDCVFETPRGQKLVGTEQVREGKISRKDSFWKILD